MNNPKIRLRLSLTELMSEIAYIITFLAAIPEILYNDPDLLIYRWSPVSYSCNRYLGT